MIRDTTRAREIAGSVVDPELPVVTLEDLGILRDIAVEDDRVTVWITPTYSGCPALTEIRRDLDTRLRQAGYREVRVRTVLSPPWSSAWITERGRRKLTENGISPPNPENRYEKGPVSLALRPPPRVACPRCDSTETEELSRFGSTACKSLWRCARCWDPFEHVKEI